MDPYQATMLLYSSNSRKVQNESATGSVSVNKVRTTLTIQVEGIDFDTQACVLRVKGRNICENQYVRVGLKQEHLWEPVCAAKHDGRDI